MSNYHFNTLAVRAGHHRTPEGEHSEAIFATSSFVFDSAAQAEARFKEIEPGNIYSRFTNPTVKIFEQRLAALEEGESCIGTGSGMAAILTTCLTFLQPGDHVICSQAVFGATVGLFNNYIKKFGIDVSFVTATDINQWQAAVTKKTRMLFLESPSNPLMEIVDIAQLATISKAQNALLVVDNCFCTPALQKPLTLGADLVIHSATKYLDGQGRCIGGAIVGSKELVEKQLVPFLRTCGPSLSPFNAWVFLKGLETLELRMQRHCDSAFTLAKWAEKHPKISKVYYPGLASHPQHQLSKRQQSHFGGLVSFEVVGGKKAAWHVIDSTKFLSITANLGDTKTTITHPSTTTHGRLSEEQRLQAGIQPSLVRVGVGLESIDDIIADLALGLDSL